MKPTYAIGLPYYRVPALAAILCWCLAAPAHSKDALAPPTTPNPVTDDYGRVKVTDPYRWLENPQDPQVHAWSLAQDARTRRYLDGLPQRAALFKKLYAQVSATSASYDHLHAAGGHVFARFTQPPKQQPMIAVLDPDLDPAHARVIVDPNLINAQGTTAIDWFVPSPDGKWVAVSLSDNGSEQGTLKVFETQSGRDTGLAIARVQFATGGGSAAWRADSKAFWYTRYPGAERAAADQQFYQQVYLHRLGEAPSEDTYVLGKDLPRVAEIVLDGLGSTRLTLASVANGDGGEFAHYLIDQKTNAVTQLTRFEDKVVYATIGADGAVYLVSRKNAPRGQLLKLAPGSTDLLQARVLVAESSAVITGGGEFGGRPVLVNRDAIYIRELLGGPSQVAIVDLNGAPKGLLPLPSVASVQELEALEDGSVVYSVDTYLRPSYFARYSASGATPEPLLKQHSSVDFEDCEVLRLTARSKDGTEVPLNIVRRKNTVLNGKNPTLLTGYGGYGISQSPFFLGPYRRAWLDAGGVYVIANLRGGGEFGETWHQQGMLTHKQNVFDDFYAVAQWLITSKYTDHDHLAILGGSNGGLLMGAELTQHPDTFRAVVSMVGIYDMLRVELDPNGAFNVTEFGSVKDAEVFSALYAYSPYHHVKDGTAYPAVFMATGETDGRVNPSHSRKMIARFQAATSSAHPILLSINSHAGHGIGSSLEIRVNQATDYLSFLFDQLGMQ